VRLLLILLLIAAIPTSAHAGDAGDERWAVTIWGLSYHVNKSIDYAASNWGLGLRYYAIRRHLFVEGDALRNSNRGLVVPVSVGAELGIGSVSECKLTAIGAFTAAYYQNPRKDTTEIKVGPVPGLSVRCGRFKTNVLAVLSKSDTPLAAIVASLTIFF
jgi:hypothetical protein